MASFSFLVGLNQFVLALIFTDAVNIEELQRNFELFLPILMHELFFRQIAKILRSALGEGEGIGFMEHGSQ